MTGGAVRIGRAIAAARRSRRIAINCVAPGPVLRPARFSRARWERVTRGHAGKVAEVGAAVLFVATCPRDITGQILKVGGAAD